MPDQALKKRFDQAMHNIYIRAKDEAGYKASIFLNTLFEHGGFLTAQRLINSPKPSEGYVALFQRGRLDLTVEAVIVEQPEWHALFSDEELERCSKRLRAYNYEPKTT